MIITKSDTSRSKTANKKKKKKVTESGTRMKSATGESHKTGQTQMTCQTKEIDSEDPDSELDDGVDEELVMNDLYNNMMDG